MPVKPTENRRLGGRLAMLDGHLQDSNHLTGWRIYTEISQMTFSRNRTLHSGSNTHTYKLHTLIYTREKVY